MNYPGGVKKTDIKLNSCIKKLDNEDTHKNRGMSLEKDLNLSNEYYRSIDKAYIYKKPTPVTIARVDYPSRNKATIKEAYFSTPSTTDYNGIYKGFYIDYEAKETQSKTSFALENIHEHQIKHLRNIERHKGIAFLIIKFTFLNKIFLLDSKDFFKYIDNTEKKSIPIEYFNECAYELKIKYQPRIDYLEIVDKLIDNMEVHNGR